MRSLFTYIYTSFTYSTQNKAHLHKFTERYNQKILQLFMRFLKLPMSGTLRHGHAFLQDSQQIGVGRV